MGIKTFKPIEIGDRSIIEEHLAADPPETSELTFTNLFIWCHQYHPIWTVRKGCLLILCQPKDRPVFGLQPVGGGDKKEALEYLCDVLKESGQEVRIGRVGEDFVTSHVDPDRFEIILDRDQSDYIYSTRDLIALSGRKYHRKKNHLNRFMKNVRHEYCPLSIEWVEQFLDMQEKWCQMKECVENPELLAEDYAVHCALTHFEELGYQGGAILVDSRVEAFSLGEALNPSTAVIHIEKANPEIPGIYTAMNQIFCQKAWSSMDFINREQDLGEEGLRKAKESYYPHHMVNKYTLVPK